MSSAILYLAIVAIWAIVLVPRWLRRPHGTPQWVEMHEEAADSGAGDAEAGPDEEAGRAAESRPPGRAATAPAARQPLTGGGQRPHERARPPAPVPVAAGRRARVLRARRRTLFTLILLAVGACTLPAVHLVPWWVAGPPIAMLGVFLLLLREAARIDSQRAAARARAGQAAAGAVGAADAVGAGRQDRASQQESGPAAGSPGPAAGPAAAQVAEPEHAAQPAAEPLAPSAEIIDISGRIGDQLYDQYTDAEARAIGD